MKSANLKKNVILYKEKMHTHKKKPQLKVEIEDERKAP